MKNCAFGDNTGSPCPIPASLVEHPVLSACPPEYYGGGCGPFIARRIVARTLDPLTRESSLDRNLGLVLGRMFVHQASDGDQPQHLRKAFAGSLFPVRARRPTQTEHVSIHRDDMILTLLGRGELALAMQCAGYEMPWWEFDADKVKVSGQQVPQTTADLFPGCETINSATIDVLQLLPAFNVGSLASLYQESELALPDPYGRGKREIVRLDDPFGDPAGA